MKTKLEGRLLGYARVSTNGQELQIQTDALLKAGVPKKLIFLDKVGGAKAARPGLDECLGQLREGDTLVVWRLNRLGRSVRHLLDLCPAELPAVRPRPAFRRQHQSMCAGRGLMVQARSCGEWRASDQPGWQLPGTGPPRSPASVPPGVLV